MSDDTRPFPIQAGTSYINHKLLKRIYPKPSNIPWWLAEEAYKFYAKEFGTAQSLERMAERGGFGREELLSLLRRENYER